MSATASWTIPEVRAALDARKISARELVKEFYARIEQRNAELNIYLALSPERAYAQADKIDAEIGQASGIAEFPLRASGGEVCKIRRVAGALACLDCRRVDHRRFSRIWCLGHVSNPHTCGNERILNHEGTKDTKNLTARSAQELFFVPSW